MAFMSCGRCGLQIRIQATHLRLEHCPRCLARSARVVPMALSASRVTPAIGWGSRAPEHRSDPREPGEPFAGQRVEEVDRREG